jgi:hypothetical protein
MHDYALIDAYDNVDFQFFFSMNFFAE